ncbi:ATP-binding protein [Streptomyces sp. 7N604]|uniref:ATP-binding protein n=1 Tax=Streptomyces sp. 7N604 TaxID=3457415 RepID=UPI003FD341CC
MGPDRDRGRGPRGCLRAGDQRRTACPRVPRGEIETRYLREGDGVRIEVHDAADMWPEKQAPDADAEHGRGLALVAALASRWGVNERVGVGKSVWAVLTTSSGDGD